MDLNNNTSAELPVIIDGGDGDGAAGGDGMPPVRRLVESLDYTGGASSAASSMVSFSRRLVQENSNDYWLIGYALIGLGAVVLMIIRALMLVTH